MRYVRDTSFLAWTAIVVALVALLVVASGVGAGEKRAPLPGQDYASVIAADRSDARTAVEAIRGLAPYGVAAGTDPAAVSAWAAQLVATADEGAAVRASEGAGSADPLLATFTLISQRATALEARSADPLAVNSLRTNVLLLIDRATALAKGLPVPAQVENLGGGSVTPTDPQMPELGELPDKPALPQPLPGDQHNHPTPNLTPDPPTAEDLP